MHYLIFTIPLRRMAALRFCDPPGYFFFFFLSLILHVVSTLSISGSFLFCFLSLRLSVFMERGLDLRAFMEMANADRFARVYEGELQKRIKESSHPIS